MNDVSGTQRLTLVSNSKRLNEFVGSHDRQCDPRSPADGGIRDGSLPGAYCRSRTAGEGLELPGCRSGAGTRAAGRSMAGGWIPARPHGRSVGVKDVFDTSDMPSEYGSGSLRGRRPTEDADAVSMLHGAGALIVGKTTTSEFGMYHPSPTHNPLDLSRSPGVSSAGSAAAVVDHGFAGARHPAHRIHDATRFVLRRVRLQAVARFHQHARLERAGPPHGACRPAGSVCRRPYAVCRSIRSQARGGRSTATSAQDRFGPWARLPHGKSRRASSARSFGRRIAGSRGGCRSSQRIRYGA